ncbi:lactococcin 972 family bacteriocin [Bacillus cytotoxicus]|uniref:Lactococcin 972 family bacteriocin n=2 Tax=Bacillus cytotoxicus TaxID=580165 RepID=A0AAX2CFE9_9BACI|nr:MULTISPECIES: lactococcin 972 family bacteriocin [Bacillus cereus group]ABS21711.1 hypothetical protein Bcer98_1390 [Bacillus cytotoxicus NVH 391-98]AWC32358.1 hypothetical protein CG482_007900 [Bacillus cytotoxicus]AWC36387.1 hypothetical protein CG481_007910 [Bacillus cytotoxicus]AWC44409.1 hypothetical protein CG479_007650 [Bacillus cytotoxicus]AWC60637.1 hypothetical protein CG474_007975 [Bacillus cytotoxicus]
MFKKVAIGTLAAGFALLGAGGALAAEQSFGKYEIVKANDQLTASYVQDENSTVKSVTSGKVDGGYWIRGKKDKNVYSSYKHYSAQGHASVVNGKGDYKSGGWKAKNVFSTAQLPWTSEGTNKAYYDHK